MIRLIKPFAPVAICILALLPGPLADASSPTKVSSRPEPTFQVNVAEAAHRAAELQHRRDVVKYVKAVKRHNEEVWYAAARANQVAAYLNAAAANHQREVAAANAAAERARRAHVVISTPAPTTVNPTPSTVNFGDLSGVVQCIKNHESGNYSESSHPGSGSGAYQFIPGTWRTWSARAGHGGYSYAYQAPPAVQDAVLAYTLTHGGAGNWSNRWGNDPCTAGLPGGG